MTEDEAFSIHNRSLTPGCTVTMPDAFYNWMNRNAQKYSVPIVFPLEEVRQVMFEQSQLCVANGFVLPPNTVKWAHLNIWKRRYCGWLDDNKVFASLGDPGVNWSDNVVYFPFHQHAVLFKLRWFE